MKRLKGPEIKMPDLKVPKPLVDLYRDLDERHLIPVAAILVVAIIAIPLLLSGSSSEPATDGPAEAGASASAAPSSRASALVVAKASPRLRDYKRRLDHLEPKDPFKQQYTAPEDSGASTSSESSPSEVPAPSEEAPAPIETGEEGSGGTNTGSTPNSELTYLSYAIDVRVVPVSAGNGKPSQADPSVRRKLPPLVALPSRDTPALTYIGPSRDREKAMMLVSDQVTALFGDSKCVLGSESCQLLALELDVPETVVFGPQARTYRIELLKMELERSDHLNRAALGKPEKSKQPQQPGK